MLLQFLETLLIQLYLSWSGYECIHARLYCDVFLCKKYNGNWDKIFSRFSERQVANGYAIADMALENYIEMRDSVNDPNYKIKRELEFELENKLWDRFVPRYSVVSFHEIPYSEVLRRE